VVHNELEVARKFTWADGNFWHLGDVTRWTSQFLIHTWTFLAIISVASQLFLCLFWISLWLKNRCLQHPCFKNSCKIAQASKNSDSNAQHFPFGFANTFMMFTPCSLHSQVTNSLILSWTGVSTLPSYLPASLTFASPMTIPSNSDRGWKIFGSGETCTQKSTEQPAGGVLSACTQPY
jgi:hypothetical protein